MMIRYLTTLKIPCEDTSFVKLCHDGTFPPNMQEPVAFAGGIFAGLLRLDLNEDPLKEWVARTVEASGVTAEEIEASDDQAEDTPQQIEIE